MTHIQAKHSFNIGDKVKIFEDEIESSDDIELLTNLLNKLLTIIDITVIDKDLVHYTCVDSNNCTIMFKDDIPFGFIDADLMYYNKE